jgi:chemosensory pili system protein ChpA (sensor histidine kinase/response regulator)
MRAAHTLGSSSRTAGFSEIANLAAAVEQWVPFARQVAQPADVDVLQAAVSRLRAMVDRVVQRTAPGDAGEEGRLVRELIARLEANPPAPVESAAPARATDARNKRLVRDDIDQQLLPVFLEEAQELVPKLGADLRAWNASPGDENISQALRRALHTLKGSARMAGAIRLGELIHAVESGIEEAIEAGLLPAELFAELEEKIDRLIVGVERLRGGPPEPVAPPAAALPQAEAQAQPEPQGVEPPPLPVATAMLRVNADKLDQLINDAGEVNIARSRVEAELRVIKLSLADLGESIARMRSQLREVEIQADSQMQSRLSVRDDRRRRYDPLEFDRYTRLQELTRLMAESLNDVDSIQRGVGQNLGETDAALLHQARTSRDVQQELMRMRAVPFSSISERLNRIVRQTARELDKKAELEIEGAQVELDRSVLERIGAPLEHMVRNALAHGLESPAARAAAGKPESGRIVVTLRQERNEIALSVVDDGSGIDLQKLHQKAIEEGVVDRDRSLTDAECMQLVFASGLSTADAITRLSGRGIGMDVVRNEITAIGGRVDVASNRGKGTTFTIFLPLTLAVTQAVLVRAGSRVLAVSSAMVEQVLRLKADAMAGHYAQKAVEFEGRSYPLHSLQHLLGVPRAAEIQSYNSVLLVRSGIQSIALHVDKLVGNQEIVVKNIGPQLARAPGVVGATVLADGGIVLIVNPVALAERARSAPAAAVPEAGGPAAIAAQGPGADGGAPVIMVVDDSLTVRKVTSRLLEREGYQVITAKDGVEALERMKEVLPAVMLVDIEMPRMDGFELTRNLRGDSRTSAIPIIIISSRTAEKHRSHAASLGVNAFLGKPFQELELLRCVSAYADMHAGKSAAAH